MKKDGQFIYLSCDNWASKYSNPHIRFDRLKRMKELFRKLHLSLGASYGAESLHKIDESQWVTL